MLIRTAFCVALLCTLGGAIVHAVAALAEASVHRAASTAAERGFAAAAAQTRDRISALIQAGADPRAIALAAFEVAPACTSSDAPHPCALSASAFVSGTLTAGVGSEPAQNCAPLCATNAQENDSVSEGRVTVRIRVAVAATDGTVYARRDRYVAFRTLRVAPFAAVSGERDAVGDTIASGAAEGDDGGISGATTANVRYVNAETGAQIDGNAWSARGWSDADDVTGTWDP